jgi:hypothetical protein
MNEQAKGSWHEWGSIYRQTKPSILARIVLQKLREGKD